MKKICVSYDCPAGKFFDESETCNGSCDAACSKCIGPKPSDCLECAEGFVEYWKDMEYNTKMCGCSMGTSRYDKDN